LTVGVDLRLLPCEAWRVMADGRVWGYSHTILNLGRVSYATHDAFEALVRPHVARLPADHRVSSFVGAIAPDGRHEGERVYGTIRDKDAYGTPYEVVEARHLLPWLAEHFPHRDHYGASDGFRAAIVAYVRALPPETKIVLDWH
jgi:hypothetical protein